MRTLGDLVASNAAQHRQELDRANADLRYLIERRDQLTEKIRFGFVALNGASLVALLGALGGGGEAAKWLGFSQHTALISAISFTLGLVLAGWSVTSQQNLSTVESGEAFVRAVGLARLVSLYELDDTEKNRETLDREMEAYAKLPLVGFQFKIRSIIAQNFSGGCWLFGISVPLCAALNINMIWPWH